MARVLSDWERRRIVSDKAIICGRTHPNTVYDVLTANAKSIIEKPVYLVYRSEHLLDGDLNRWRSIVVFDAPESLEELIVQMRDFEAAQQFQITLGWEREWTAVYINAEVLPIGTYIPERFIRAGKKLGRILFPGL
jgi:hypothetical protein